MKTVKYSVNMYLSYFAVDTKYAVRLLASLAQAEETERNGNYSAWVKQHQ